MIKLLFAANHVVRFDIPISLLLEEDEKPHHLPPRTQGDLSPTPGEQTHRPKNDHRRREGAAVETQRAFNNRLAPLCADYRRLWLARSRYGGLQDSYQKLKSLAG
jgi:hypothetical protein